MRCPSCGWDNPDAASSCDGCGKALAPCCSHCGADLRPSARFCDSCGQAVTEPAAPPPSPTAPLSPAHRRPAQTAPGRIGTSTLLFTDIERSTEVLQKLGDDQARELWRTHFRLLRSAVAARGGQEVKNLGDGLMVAFASALDALACAVAMQLAVHRHNQRREEEHRLQVRVGLHVGEPIRDEEDYFGMPVVVAKRLCDCAEGGQIVASDLVRRLVGSRGGYTFRDVGPLPLKGIPEPFSACELIWEAVVEELAAPPLPLSPQLAGGERSAFVGRDSELEQLSREWLLARAGQRRLVLIAGEPGIGKTRLAAEFALTAHAEGATVLFGGTEEGAALLYQPFVEALRHYVAACPLDDLRAQLKGSGGELASLIPELAQRLPDLPVPPPAEPGNDRYRIAGERYRLFDAFAGLLARASRACPIVLVLDDLQWADKPTLLLLKHIMRWPEQSPLLIVGVYRETELPRTHPLAEALADLRRERAFERLSLEGLNEADVSALIGAWAGREAPPAFVRAVHEQTEGNPFFIEEVLRHLAESGAIYQRGGRWTTDLTLDQMGIPEGVHEVIGRRLSRLSEECNSVLTVASVIGREFDLEALGRASDLPRDRLLDLLEEAVAARVVAEVPHIVGCYRFSHALIHQTLYDELTTTRRVHLHGQILRYADNEGVKLAYEVLGASGPYLIGVGLSNCPAVRTGSMTLTRRWDRISRCCRVILYDRRGVGFSSAPERGYRLSACVKDLRAVLDAVGVGQVILWGATDGGPLALAFAVQHPDRVAGLVLAGTTPRLLCSADFGFGIAPSVMDSFLRRDAVDRGGAVGELMRTRPLEPGEAIGEVMKRVPQRAWSGILGALGFADARLFLPQVQVPTLIVHDPDNQYIPVEAAYYLHERIPDSQLEITEEAGTPLFGDALFRRIQGFIEAAAARSDV